LFNNNNNNNNSFEIIRVPRGKHYLILEESQNGLQPSFKTRNNKEKFKNLEHIETKTQFFFKNKTWKMIKLGFNSKLVFKFIKNNFKIFNHVKLPTYFK
jgi:hypothetical protein